MDSNIFKLNPSLETMSGIAVAINFWERPDISHMIGDNFFKGKKFKYDPDGMQDVKEVISKDIDGKSSSGQEIVNYIFGQIDSLRLPEKLKQLIKTFVVKIGQKIGYWREYVVDVLKLDVKYAQKICWTSYGEVNDLKIVQEFWLQDSGFPGVICSIPGCSMQKYLYCIASMYAQEDFIRCNFIDVKKKILSVSPDQVKYAWAQTAMPIWLRLCTAKMWYHNEREESLAEHMFLGCIALGFEFAVKYFWNQLAESEQQDLVISGAEESLKLAVATLNKRGGTLGSASSLIAQNVKLYCCHSGFKREAAVRILLFLIEQMTEIQKIEFLSKKFLFLFRLLIETWPYQDMCEKLLDAVWDHISEYHRQRLLIEVLYYINVDFKVTKRHPTGFGNHKCEKRKAKHPTLYFNTIKFYTNLFHILMKKVISKESKEEVLGCFWECIGYYYKSGYNVLLSIIINDPDLESCKEVKEVTLLRGIGHFTNCIFNGDYEAVNKFIEIVGLADVELKQFKKKLNLLDAFLAKGDITACVQNMNWICDSDAEKSEMKKKLNATEICWDLITSNKFEAADEFLEWMYYTVEMREIVKQSLISSNLIDRIFQIWESENSSDSKTILTISCLSWFFKSDEEITNFKISKLIPDERFITKYYKTLIDEEVLFTSDDFLKFCLPTLEDIELFKTSIADNLNWWIDFYGLKKGIIEILYRLVKWAFNCDRHKKLRVVASSISSSRGALLCVKILENYDEEKKPPRLVLNFFRKWINRFTNFSKLYLYLDKLKEEGVIDSLIIFNVKKLLKERERGSDLTDWSYSKTQDEDKLSDNDYDTDSHDDTDYYITFAYTHFSDGSDAESD